eukprot:scaffold88981_cov32-Tisochrysis_lutea.AAC.6
MCSGSAAAGVAPPPPTDVSMAFGQEGSSDRSVSEATEWGPTSISSVATTVASCRRVSQWWVFSRMALGRCAVSFLKQSSRNSVRGCEMPGGRGGCCRRPGRENGWT